MKYTEETTPAIMRCDYGAGEPVEFKVSPHGPDDADRGAFWCETKAEAIKECDRIAGVARHTVTVTDVYGSRERADAIGAAITKALAGCYWFEYAGACPQGGSFAITVQTKGLDDELEATRSVLSTLADRFYGEA
jgi:hypothetical protein